MLSEQAVRNWKLATAVLTAGVAFHSTLYAEYEMPAHLQGEKHVFTDLQHWYKSWMDRNVWNLPPPTTSTSSSTNDTNTQQQQDNATTTRQQKRDGNNQ